MKEVKSTNLAKTHKRSVKLPPQKSADDTSNWEDRNVSAPHIDVTRKKRTVRELEFIQNKSEPVKLTPKQFEKLEAQNRIKKYSK
jgi:hypothetical protein